MVCLKKSEKIEEKGRRDRNKRERGERNKQENKKETRVSKRGPHKGDHIDWQS